jgi:hypothetical protein
MSWFDDTAERLARRSAARSTRRTFLSRLGKTAVIVAGGPTLASLLVERAEARVCGQSGVAPKCPTFDCTYADSVWGWCWYASPGCCAGGGLKKICDCCTLDWPFVHGYCPSGHNVRCIVESCLEDPRVMTKPVQRALGTSASAVALARSRTRADADVVVLGDADDVGFAAVAGAVAAHLRGPLLLTARGRLASGVIAEVQRLGAARVIAAGSVPQAHLDELSSYGVATQHLGLDPVDVARWMIERTGRDHVVCIESAGVSKTCAAAAAAAAGQRGMPVVLGVDAAKELGATATWLVGPEAVARAGELSGGFPMHGATKEEVALSLATAVMRNGDRGVVVKVAPSGAPDVSVGLGGEGGVLLFHPDGALGSGAYGFIHNHREQIEGALAGGTLGALGEGGIYDLQSALHGFDTHLLIGVPGQGLPVISQPHAEREPGRARVKGAPPKDDGGAYWTGRARPRP